MTTITKDLPGANLPRMRTAARRPHPAETVGASLFVAVPALFTGAFTALTQRFDYPDILRQPAGDILTRFHQSDSHLLPLWWGMFTSALLFIPASYYGARAAGLRGGTLTAATVTGAVAGIVQAVGLARWVFLVPLLAARYAEPGASPATQDTARLLFESFHQFVGMGVGEWLGYLVTGLWTLLIAGHLWASSGRKAAGRIWGGVGLVAGAGVLVGLLEVFGLGWAGAVNALAYLLWSLWLIALGVSLLVTRFVTRSVNVKG